MEKCIRLARLSLIVWRRKAAKRTSLRLTELQNLTGEIREPDLFALATASIGLLGAYFASAAIWGLIVHDLGGPKIPVKKAISILQISKSKYLLSSNFVK